MNLGAKEAFRIKGAPEVGAPTQLRKANSITLPTQSMELPSQSNKLPTQPIQVPTQSFTRPAQTFPHVAVLWHSQVRVQNSGRKFKASSTRVVRTVAKASLKLGHQWPL